MKYLLTVALLCSLFLAFSAVAQQANPPELTGEAQPASDDQPETETQPTQPEQGPKPAMPGPVREGAAPPQDLIHQGLRGEGGKPAMPGPVRAGAQAPSDAIHRGAMEREADKPANTTPIGSAPAKIKVTRQREPQQDAPQVPEAGVSVRLHWTHPSTGQIVAEYRATSDASGWAEFGTIEIYDDSLILQADYREGETLHSSDKLELIDDEFIGHLPMMQVSADLLKTKMSSVIMVLQLPPSLAENPRLYDLIEVQQLYLITTTDWSIYDTSQAKTATDTLGIPLAVPEGAVSVQGQVLNGRPGRVQIDKEGRAFFRGQAVPEELGPTQVMVSFFLEAGEPELDFVIPPNHPRDGVEVVVLSDTLLPRVGTFDATLRINDSTGSANDEDRRWPGRHVLRLELFGPAANKALSVHIGGLPYPSHQLWHWAALVAVLLGGFVVGLLLLKGRQPKANKRAALQSQLNALLFELSQGPTEPLTRQYLELRAAAVLAALDACTEPEAGVPQERRS